MRVLSPDQCREIVRAFDAAEHKNDESSLAFYSNSVGITDLPATLVHAQRITEGLAARYPGLVFSNSYTRQYIRGSVLRPHIDRPGLDLTLSVCLEKDTPVAWPLHVSRRTWPHGEWRADVDFEPYRADSRCYDMAEGVGALCEGRRHPHWREEFDCAPGERAVYVFYHWTLPQRRWTPSLSLAQPRLEVIEEVLSEAECRQLIEQASGGPLARGACLLTGRDPGVEELCRRLAEVAGGVGFAAGAAGGTPALLITRLQPGEMPGDLAWGPGPAAPAPDGSMEPAIQARMVVHLNTPAEGGHTRLAEPGLRIQARRGRAIVLVRAAATGSAGPLPAPPPEVEPVTAGERWVATLQLQGFEA